MKPARAAAGYRIRAAVPGDAGAIAGIYNHYIANAIATFEEDPVAAPDMARRIKEIAALPLPWLVAESAAGVAGYAYASRWKGRCAYRFSVESTVYVDAAAVGRGVGALLYAALVERLRLRNIHSVIAGIALPNNASIRLHEKLGFQKIAHFHEVGFKFGRWIDVGYWQLLLSR